MSMQKEKLEEQIAALRGVAGALVGGVLCDSALLGCNLMGEVLRSSGGQRGQRAGARAGWRLGYVTAGEGLTCTKPNLGPVAKQGSKGDHNALDIPLGGGGLFDPRASDTARRYKFAFLHQEHKPYGTSLAFSPEGVH